MVPSVLVTLSLSGDHLSVGSRLLTMSSLRGEGLEPPAPCQPSDGCSPGGWLDCDHVRDPAHLVTPSGA